MSKSGFSTSTGKLIGVSIAIALFWSVLIWTGALVGVADHHELGRILRAVLLLVATVLFGTVLLELVLYHSDPQTGLAKWLDSALAIATGCVIAAWIVTNQLR